MLSASWSRPPRGPSTAESRAVVASVRNRRVIAAARLTRSRDRAAAGLALIEGPHLLAEASAARLALREVFGLPEDDRSRRTAAAAGADWVPVAPAVLARLATTETPQSPVAVFEVPESRLPEAGHLLVAWGVGDPGNLGTLIRTAAAFGMGFAAGPNTADPWSPKVLRSGAGGHFRTTVARVADVEPLRGLSRALVATVVRGGAAPAALRGKGDVAVLVGDEASGLAPEVVAAADLAVTIPMPGGTESLNAAAAGAILAYEITAMTEREVDFREGD